MKASILITGSTDGIGLETVRALVAQGHHVLLHGRNPDKLAHVVTMLSAETDGASVESYVADLSNLADVETLASEIAQRHQHLDVLINNAGIFRTADPVTQYGIDIRFVVNTLAPYLLTHRLLPLLSQSSRVINLSSAAQSTVNIDALTGRSEVTDEFEAYAQSKLAITMWSRSMAQSPGYVGPAIIAVNPGSMLASKMVTEGFGVAGNDIGIGVDILIRAALSDEFADANGQYFDNDSGQFTAPHADALDPEKTAQVVHSIKSILGELTV